MCLTVPNLFRFVFQIISFCYLTFLLNRPWSSLFKYYKSCVLLISFYQIKGGWGKKVTKRKKELISMKHLEGKSQTQIPIYMDII